MQGSVRALKAVAKYTIPAVHEIKSNNTQNLHTHNSHSLGVKTGTYVPINREQF